MLHGSPALFQVEVIHPLAGRQDLIRHHKISLPRIIAVLQRGADKLDLILVPGDLRQETPAGSHNRHVITENFCTAGCGREAIRLTVSAV